MNSKKNAVSRCLRLLWLVPILFMASPPAFAQNVVKGKVTTERGEPLVGATVAVVRKNISRVTGNDGSYSINASAGDVLQFTFTGYEPEEVTVGENAIINVSLSAVVKEMDQVVVVGYGTVKKRDLTGSVVSLDADKLNQGVQPSVANMLQGRAPGVQITSMSGEPGSGFGERIQYQDPGSQFNKCRQ